MLLEGETVAPLRVHVTLEARSSTGQVIVLVSLICTSTTLRDSNICGGAKYALNQLKLVDSQARVAQREK